jgi:6-hydroxycyclohex-1-ene-1-carbonyl-CoA dehydrogenase
VVGRVVAAAPGHEHLLSRDVVVPAVMPCGRCERCRRGRGDICRAQVFPGNDVDGGFASHLVVPAAPLCVLPEGAFSAAEIERLAVVADAVSTAYAAVRNSGLRAGDFAVFVGAGGVGGFGVQIASSLGARVLAVDVDEERLALLAEHGADWVLDARGLAERDLKKRVRAIAEDAELPDAEWRVFEASGTPAGQQAAFALLNHGAVLSVIGYHPGDVTVRLSNLMALAARAEGTWGCPPALFPEVLDLVKGQKVALEPFVEVHPLSAINDVFQALRRHQLKRRAVLVPDLA